MALNIQNASKIVRSRALPSCSVGRQPGMFWHLMLYTSPTISGTCGLWTQGGMKGARYNRSKSGWFDAVTFQDWFQKLFVPYAKRLGQRVVLIGDNLASHLSVKLVLAKNARLVCQQNTKNEHFPALPQLRTILCETGSGIWDILLSRLVWHRTYHIFGYIP